MINYIECDSNQLNKPLPAEGVREMAEALGKIRLMSNGNWLEWYASHDDNTPVYSTPFDTSKLTERQWSDITSWYDECKNWTVVSKVLYIAIPDEVFGLFLMNSNNTKH